MNIDFVSCNFTEFFTLFCFLVEFLEFVCNIIWNRQFYFFLFNLDAFYFFSFSCLITLARTSNTMLNKSGRSGHLCLVSNLRGKDFSFSPWRWFSLWACHIWPFIILMYILSVPHLLSIFIKEECQVLSDAFSTSIEMIIWFLFFILMLCVTMIDLEMLKFSFFFFSFLSF